MNFSQKFKNLRKEKSLTQAEIAEKLGVNIKTIIFWETGKNLPSQKNIETICNILNVTFEYFYDSDDLYHIPNSKYYKLDAIKHLNPNGIFNKCYNESNTVEIKNTIKSQTDDTTIIERIHINPSCGNGTIVLDEVEIEPIKLSTNLITNILKASKPENLKIFRASGDSMEPTIFDGDMLLVDIGRTDYHNSGIFVITVNNDWKCKRLNKKINGDLEIISDNKNKYEVEIKHQTDEDIEIIIIGRVIKNLSRGL